MRDPGNGKYKDPPHLKIYLKDKQLLKQNNL